MTLRLFAKNLWCRIQILTKLCFTIDKNERSDLWIFFLIACGHKKRKAIAESMVSKNLGEAPIWFSPVHIPMSWKYPNPLDGMDLSLIKVLRN